MSAPQQTLETLATNATPIPVAVSTATLLGITLQDWVFIGTALLVLCQLVILIPKAYKNISSIFKRKPNERK